jgi:hypothetical protein
MIRAMQTSTGRRGARRMAQPLTARTRSTPEQRGWCTYD